MSVYTDVLQAVIDLMNSMNPYAPVIIGAMPPDDGISAAWASSAYNPFFNKLAAVEMTAVLNGKHNDQKTVLDGLGAIHTGLSMRKEYPAAENFQITDISTLGAPSYLGREENKEWLYGSSLRVKFYVRGS